MGFRSSMAALCMLILVCTSYVTATVDGSAGTIGLEYAARWKISGIKEVVVPILKFNSRKCYRRTQECCYKYYSCGKHCKKDLCTQKPECSLMQQGRCVRYRTIKVCKARCYHKMCPRYECAPLATSAQADYKTPEPYQSVLSTGEDEYKH